MFAKIQKNGGIKIKSIYFVILYILLTPISGAHTDCQEHQSSREYR